MRIRLGELRRIVRESMRKTRFVTSFLDGTEAQQAVARLGKKFPQHRFDIPHTSAPFDVFVELRSPEDYAEVKAEANLINSTSSSYWKSDFAGM